MHPSVVPGRDEALAHDDRCGDRAKAPGAAQEYKVVSGGLTIGPSTPSWGSWSGDGHYPTSTDLHDDFAYDSVNHVLYIEGTVYVTGDLTISQDITYVGDGTIVCTGNVSISADAVPATTVMGADGTPDPDARHLLCIFSGGTVTFGANNTHFTGAVYSTGQLVGSGNNQNLKGSFISEAGLGSIGNGTVMSALPSIGTFISPGMPTWGSSGQSTLGLTISSWQRQ